MGNLHEKKDKEIKDGANAKFTHAYAYILSVVESDACDRYAN